MKKKILALTLCFTIIISNLNLHSNRSYANNFVMSPTMVATIGTLLVGSNVVLNSAEDIVGYSRAFYEKNRDNWEDVKKVFETCVTIGANKVVTVGKEFVYIFKSTFDFLKESDSDITVTDGHVVTNMITNADMTIDYINTWGVPFNPPAKEKDFSAFGYDFKYVKTSSNGVYYYDYVVGNETKRFLWSYEKDSTNYYYKSCVVKTLSGYSHFIYSLHKTLPDYFSAKTSAVISDLITLPYGGTYDDTNIKDDSSVGVYVPGNVGDLVGVPGGSTLEGAGSPSYDLPVDGVINLPNYQDQGISIGGSTTFPLGGTVDTPIDPPSDIPSDIPNEGLFASIKDFVISLVVPSDTFWTDTFNGFRDNFSKNFPMLDMSKFDSLAVGGKPFPNLYAYGSKIVDGDVINSIVDWLRPIIAGFIMICLMFFNYRKIYKLIRNTEPFGGIAQGSSDFRTGLSAPPINNGLDPNPMGNLRDTLFDMRNEILRRENSK